MTSLPAPFSVICHESFCFVISSLSIYPKPAFNDRLIGFMETARCKPVVVYTRNLNVAVFLPLSLVILCGTDLNVLENILFFADIKI